MKKILVTVILILSLVVSPIFAERNTPEYSAEIMGNGKLLHITDYGLFYMQYSGEIHVCTTVVFKRDGSLFKLDVICANTKSGDELN